MTPEKVSMRCWIAGGEAAGRMLSLLLARAGVEVQVLEKNHTSQESLVLPERGGAGAS